jgi:hypothetical protein
MTFKEALNDPVRRGSAAADEQGQAGPVPIPSPFARFSPFF